MSDREVFFDSIASALPPPQCQRYDARRICAYQERPLVSVFPASGSLLQPPCSVIINPQMQRKNCRAVSGMAMHDLLLN